MSLTPNYHLRHSLPARSPSSRPRSLSLSEYQPLAFDREALESAYHQSLGLSSGTASINPSTSYSGTTVSADTHDTAPSSLSHQLKPGDNPHVLSPPPKNFAGIGAGHSLTPPHSPFHNDARQLQDTLLSPVRESQSPLSSPLPPTPPPRPSELPSSTYPQRQSSGIGFRRAASEMSIDEGFENGYQSDHGRPAKATQVARGKRRALPPVPTNVPVPEPPPWEPDIKAHIPPELTAASVQNAYAQLSAPPPNLPPRRNPRRTSTSSSPVRPRTGRQNSRTARPQPQAAPSSSFRGDVNMATSSTSREATNMAPSSSFRGDVNMTPSASFKGDMSMAPSASYKGDMNMAAGSSRPMMQSPASDYPLMTEEPADISPTSAQQAQNRNRPQAEKEVLLRATEKTPIWSTHYLDPCLRNPLVNIPHQVTNVTNIALTGLSSGPKTKYNATIGAPIDGLARMAKDWVVKPDARFVTEGGGIEVGVAVVDSGVEGWGKEKGRKRARVECMSKAGGIKVDIIEIDANRQIDLRIETKHGDVLVLLPEEYYGPLHITSPGHEPTFLPILAAQLQPIANPYASFYTTFVVPLHLAQDPKKSRSAEHRAMSTIQKYVPQSLREQSDIFDQVVGGFASHTRGEQSKITVQSTKGRVVIGYRETKDEQDVLGLGLVVGAKAPQGKKKRWWR